MNMLLLGILAYVLLQLGVGLWVSRQAKNEEDYLIAGRRLPLGMSIMTIFATWFGAETCIGASGEVYALGLSGGRADPLRLCLVHRLHGARFRRAPVATSVRHPRRPVS